MSTGRYAITLVLWAEDAEEAFDTISDVLPEGVEYASNAWEVANRDGSYDFDSVLEQKYNGPTRPDGETS